MHKVIAISYKKQTFQFHAIDLTVVSKPVPKILVGVPMLRGALKGLPQKRSARLLPVVNARRAPQDIPKCLQTFPRVPPRLETFGNISMRTRRFRPLPGLRAIKSRKLVARLILSTALRTPSALSPQVRASRASFMIDRTLSSSPCSAGSLSAPQPPPSRWS